MSCARIATGQFILLCSFTGLIEQLQGDGKSWCDGSCGSPGETLWTGNSMQGAYCGEFCTLIIIMKM